MLKTGFLPTNKDMILVHQPHTNPRKSDARQEIVHWSEGSLL